VRDLLQSCVCVGRTYYKVVCGAGPITKLCGEGEEESCGHVISRTSERGGKGDCVKGGVGEEGERVEERALGMRRRYSCRRSSLSTRRLSPP